MTHAGYLRSDTVSYVPITQGIRVVAAADDAARNGGEHRDSNEHSDAAQDAALHG